MSLFFQIHPDNPQSRLISQVVDIVHKGGVIIYPTDSSYALGCHIGDKFAMERIPQIRRVGPSHDFALVCRDLSEIATYAKLNNSAFRLIKALTPGPYTFILEATKEVPRRLQNPKRKTIGLRIPNNAIVQALLETMGEPLMSSTLILPGEDMPMTDPYEMRDTLGNQVDAIIDGGYCGYQPSTIVDLVGEEPIVVRKGLGDTEIFETTTGE